MSVENSFHHDSLDLDSVSSGVFGLSSMRIANVLETLAYILCLIAVPNIVSLLECHLVLASSLASCQLSTRGQRRSSQERSPTTAAAQGAGGFAS